MGQFAISIVGGATLGATYALIGVGLVLAFRATGTLSFAHGQLMLLCAFVVAYWQQQNAFSSFWVELLFGLCINVVIAVVFYLLVLKRLAGLPHFISFVATLGLAAILDGYMPIKFGSNDYSIRIPGLPVGSIRWFGAYVSSASIVLALVAFGITFIVAGFLRYTRLGVNIRAAGQDPVLASQGGIQVRLLHMASWGIAGVLAGLAGVVYGNVTVVNTSLEAAALAAFPAILLGGLESIEGAILGGLLIGMLQGFTSSYLGGQYINLVTYGLLLVVLLVRPQGLFGRLRVSRI